MERPILARLAGQGFATVSFARLAGAASPELNACATRSDNTHTRLQERVALDGARKYRAVSQAIADADGDKGAAVID